MNNTMNKKVRWGLSAPALAVCGFLALGLPVSASAQRPLFANVSADAQCTVTGSPVEVTVDAGLIQKDVPSSSPVVSSVSIRLEEHLPGQKAWSLVPGTATTQTFSPAMTFTLLPAGELYEVTTQDYQGVCTQVSAAANAVRAVVQITVDNANDKRPGGQVFTARCTSFPNPCR